MVTPRVRRALRLRLQLEKLRQRRAALDRKIQQLEVKIAHVEADFRGGEPDVYHREVAEVGLDGSTSAALPSRLKVGRQ